MMNANDQKNRRRNTDKLLDALVSIRRVKHAQDVEELLTSGVTALGFERWALIIGTKTDRAIDHLDLVGLTSCAGAWFTTYLKRHCIEIDPFFVYCHHSNQPITFPHDVKAQSIGQEGFLATLAGNGYAYGVAIPIHLAQARLAMFYTGTRAERSKGELCNWTPLLGALAQEAAIWVETARLVTAIKAFPTLSQSELDHLAWVLKGFQNKEIAEFTNSTSSATNNVFRRINEKLGTHSRKEAALKAEKLGLWRM